VSAIQLYLEHSFDPSTQVRVESRLDEEPDAETRVMLYRIAQEALTNIRKHAAANDVWVVIETVAQGTRVCIDDDGVGFDLEMTRQKHRPGHVGLLDMEERTAMAGGWWRCARRDSGGTRVEFWIPHGEKGSPAVTRD
jgi:signal transduction histidine kinase